MRVDDGDHTGAVGAPAAGAVRCAFLVWCGCWQGACQLGDNFTHHREARLQSLDGGREKICLYPYSICSGLSYKKNPECG